MTTATETGITSPEDIKHANLILEQRWPDAAIGEVHSYRPLIGEWHGATDWMRAVDCWQPVAFVTTTRRVLVNESAVPS